MRVLEGSNRVRGGLMGIILLVIVIGVGQSFASVPMLFAGLGYWVIGFTLGWYLAFHTDLAGVGVWIGLAGGLAATAVLMCGRWLMRGRLGLAPIAP